MARKKKEIKLSKKKKTEFNVLYNSIIGNPIKVVESTNNTLIGLSGELVYESQNLFFIKTSDDTIKKVLKNSVKFELKIGDDKFLIDGRVFLGTLVQRIKKIK